ncbi:MAG: hypothetical protein ABSC19_20760 [Syntrophorhabdales bacterium]
MIAYLPALNQSFSRRETNISMLDARAGSPPTAVGMLAGHNRGGGMNELREQLSLWERWSAELLESHLSYPVLAHYRSQHDNQSWLAALTAVLDTAAIVLVGVRGVCTRQAELTFAMACHAVIDLAAVFNQPPKRPEKDRLDHEGFRQLKSMLEGAGLELTDDHEYEYRLQRIRESYEPYVHALARYFQLSVPPLIPEAGRHTDWQTTPWGQMISFADDSIGGRRENRHVR